MLGKHDNPSRIFFNILTTIIEFRVGKLQCVYLGLPLGTSYMSKAIWEYVIEMFYKSLKGWK